MKVENPLTTPSSAINPADNSAARTAQKPGSAAPDQVRLSGDLRLAKAAVQAVQSGPDVRADKVAEARALLDSGELGTDLERLADRIVDALAYSHDDDPA